VLIIMNHMSFCIILFLLLVNPGLQHLLFMPEMEF